MELASYRVYCTNQRHATLNIMKQYPSKIHNLFSIWIRMIKARNPKTEIAGDFSLDVFSLVACDALKEHCLQWRVIRSMKLNWSAKYMFFYCVNYRVMTPLCPTPSTLLTQYLKEGCCYPLQKMTTTIMFFTTSSKIAQPKLICMLQEAHWTASPAKQYLLHGFFLPKGINNRENFGGF